MVPDAAVQAIAKVIAEQIQRIEMATYHTYIRAFSYSVEQHIKSFDIYRKNLVKFTENKYNIELALFSGFTSQCADSATMYF